VPYCAYTREDIRLKRESRHKRGGKKRESYREETEEKDLKRRPERGRRGKAVAVIQRHT